MGCRLECPLPLVPGSGVTGDQRDIGAPCPSGPLSGVRMRKCCILHHFRILVSLSSFRRWREADKADLCFHQLLWGSLGDIRGLGDVFICRSGAECSVPPIQRCLHAGARVQRLTLRLCSSPGRESELRSRPPQDPLRPHEQFPIFGAGARSNNKAMEIATERTEEERSSQDKVDEEVFKKAYIPRTLNEVNNYERDVGIMQKIKEEDLSLNTQHDNILYQTVTGLKKDLSGAETIPALLQNTDQGQQEDSDSDGHSGDESASDSEEEVHRKDQTPYTEMDKKERKKLAKEAQREKRKNKVPKHVKKRKEKTAKMKKGR